MSKFKAVLSKKIVKIPLCILIFVLIIVIWKLAVNDDGNYEEKYAGADLSVDIDGIARDDTYAKYLDKHKDDACPKKEVDVDIFDYLPSSTGVSVVNDVDGESQVLQSDELVYQSGTNLLSDLYPMYGLGSLPRLWDLVSSTK